MTRAPKPKPASTEDFRTIERLWDQAKTLGRVTMQSPLFPAGSYQVDIAKPRGRTRVQVFRGLPAPTAAEALQNAITKAGGKAG